MPHRRRGTARHTRPRSARRAGGAASLRSCRRARRRWSRSASAAYSRRRMRTSACTGYPGYRFPAEIIGHAVWLYFRFPLGLRMVEELLAARGIIVSHETVRQWARKFGQPFANQIRRRLPGVGDKWHLDEVVLKIAGVKHW